MCYGFESKVEAALIVRILMERKFNIDVSELLKGFKKENIRPIDKVVCFHRTGDKLQVSLIYWGIKFSKDKPSIVNSRIETIKEKKFWRDLYENNRCLIPMTSFYEWIEVGEKKMQHKIYIYNKEFFFVPGIVYRDKDKTASVSIITTTPNKFIEPFHNRMPVLLTIDEALQFIQEPLDQSLARLKPFADSENMRKEELIIQKPGAEESPKPKIKKKRKGNE